jgi:HlyD family secretion protein
MLSIPSDVRGLRRLDAGGAYWWHASHPGLPLGIVSGNGRIEADEIDIDTKFAGRIAEMLADEGDMVRKREAHSCLSTAPVALSLKPKPTQRRAEFAGMAVAAPSPAQ